MTPPPTNQTIEELLNPERIAPSTAIIGAFIALDAALANNDNPEIEHDRQTIDLLFRIELSPQRACRAVDLAEQLMISTSHMSRVIDKVEALGLVTRIPDPNDRRANHVVMTPEGSDVLTAVAPYIAQTLDRVIHHALTPDEINTLIDLLGRIEREAREPQQNPNHPTSPCN